MVLLTARARRNSLWRRVSHGQAQGAQAQPTRGNERPNPQSHLQSTTSRIAPPTQPARPSQTTGEVNQPPHHKGRREAGNRKSQKRKHMRLAGCAKSFDGRADARPFSLLIFLPSNVAVFSAPPTKNSGSSASCFAPDTALLMEGVPPEAVIAKKSPKRGKRSHYMKWNQQLNSKNEPKRSR